MRWTQIPGERCFIVKAFCLEEQRLQIWIANLSDVLDLYVAQVVAFAVEEFAEIFHRSAARKAKRDMLPADAKVANRPVPFENGDAPGIHGLLGSRHRFFHQGTERVHHMDESGIFAGHIE